MDAIPGYLFAAADNHGADTGEPDHTVGDLQDVFRKAWALMLPSQRVELLQSNAVDSLLECGARGKFKPSTLVNRVRASLAQMEAAITAAGYTITEVEDGYYWETEAEISVNFLERIDTVFEAYQSLQKNAAAAAAVQATGPLGEVAA